MQVIRVPFDSSKTEAWDRDASTIAVPASRAVRIPDFERYELLELVGSGGFGTVYRARDRQLGRQVALKIPRDGALRSQRQLRRFLREASTAAKLNHPNICPVYDAGTADGVPYIVMGFVEGQTLQRVLAKRKRVPIKQAILAIRELADALQEAHRQGIVHRDLKPSNVIFDARHRQLKILDFGLAVQVNVQGPRLTVSGDVLGTPTYMAPEQVRGEVGQIGPRTDVYSLGVMLYELLAGRPPHTGSTAEIFGKILFEDPEPPSAHVSGVPPALDQVCLTAIRKSPDDRFDSMSAFDRELKQILQGKSRVSRTVVRDRPDQPDHGKEEPPSEPADWLRVEVPESGTPCPKCKALLAAGTVLCTKCGFHSGMNHQFDVLAERPAEPPSRRRAWWEDQLEHNEDFPQVLALVGAVGLLLMLFLFTMLYRLLGAWLFLVVALFVVVGMLVLRRLALEHLDLGRLVLALQRATSWRLGWPPFRRRKVLDMRFTATADEDVVTLKADWGIEVLDLEGTAVSDSFVDALSDWRDLRNLVVRETGVTEAAVQRIREKIPQLQVWTSPLTRAQGSR